MSDASEKPREGFPCNIVDGVRVPRSVTQEHLDKMKHMKLYPDDVWVTCYPRSGSTWTQWIVRLIQNKGKPDDVDILQASPFVDDLADAAVLDDLPCPRAFKSHFPYEVFCCGPPHETPCKYIYMARNPKDVVVSLYCMVKQGHFPDIQWEMFLKLFLGGVIAYGSYCDHVLGWWSRRNEKNILFLKYEDRKKDPSGQIKQIAEFLGAELSSQEMSKVLELATFGNMKNNSKANLSSHQHYDKDGEPMFLRKGVVGDWKNFFTPEQSREMDALCNEKFKGTGLELEYE